MANRSKDGVESDLKQRKQIVVVYEDGAAREYAVRSAPHLVESHPLETSTVVEWWSFARLSESEGAGEAAISAAAADLLIFVVSPAGDLPEELKLWIENWIARRSEREGTIIGMMAGSASPGEIACLKEIYLRHVAHRAGMDYLSQVPSAWGRAMPDSLESYGDRARQVTSLLDEILRSGSPPPGVDL
jgi:hypothetical protein